VLMSYREIVSNNLDILCKSTHVSVELAARVLEKKLVGEEDHEILTAQVVCPTGQKY